eukprot:gene26680-biopygen4508
MWYSDSWWVLAELRNRPWLTLIPQLSKDQPSNAHSWDFASFGKVQGLEPYVWQRNHCFRHVLEEMFFNTLTRKKQNEMNTHNDGVPDRNPAGILATDLAAGSAASIPNRFRTGSFRMN